jgi:hypothetical protein
LNDVDAGTVLEGLTAKEYSTCNGLAMVISVVEVKRGQRLEYDLMIPERFKTLCEEKLPCLLYYDGKKPMKNGKEAHDLRFIPIDDPKMFHESDDEFDEEDKVKEIEVTEQSKGTQTDEVSDQEPHEPCDSCVQEGRICPGFCTFCSNHQPLNGAQCRCLII